MNESVPVSMPFRPNFLNYALRVFLVTLLLPGFFVVGTAAVVCYVSAADGSIVRGLLAAVLGAGLWGTIGTLAAAQTAFSMGASRIVDHAAVGSRLGALLQRRGLTRPDAATEDISLAEFRSMLRANQKNLVMRPEDSRPASLVGSWLLRHMQRLAVRAITRLVRRRFTERVDNRRMVDLDRLSQALTGEIESRVVGYVRRQACLLAIALCFGGIALTAALIWLIRQLPL